MCNVVIGKGMEGESAGRKAESGPGPFENHKRMRNPALDCDGFEEEQRKEKSTPRLTLA